MNSRMGTLAETLERLVPFLAFVAVLTAGWFWFVQPCFSNYGWKDLESDDSKLDGEKWDLGLKLTWPILRWSESQRQGPAGQWRTGLSVDR